MCERYTNIRACIETERKIKSEIEEDIYIYTYKYMHERIIWSERQKKRTKLSKN